ncbi:hypothetical protein, partial [uncultured Bacteroides sp.]|uniref:hypothetical protein n=1 Tax=uncultured Bacteroides sp. TaxID=162156 RepID=UPI0025D1F00A
RIVPSPLLKTINTPTTNQTFLPCYSFIFHVMLLRLPKNIFQQSKGASLNKYHKNELIMT